MDTNTIEAYLYCIKHALKEKGIATKIEGNPKMITIFYKRRSHTIYYGDYRKRFILHYSDNTAITLPIDFGDPQCFDKLITHLDEWSATQHPPEVPRKDRTRRK